LSGYCGGSDDDLIVGDVKERDSTRNEKRLIEKDIELRKLVEDRIDFPDFGLAKTLRSFLDFRKFDSNQINRVFHSLGLNYLLLQIL
jgi:hypothetical protein